MSIAEVATSELPRPVREIRDTWIPMPDGTRLAARIWLPVDGEVDPVPGILELLPYRKSDGTALRDARNAPYFAGHGYAVVRVDIRGTGNSTGVITDEYTETELADGVACIAWIAAQSWCTGKVGIMGISWGGFNGLQIAALRPPELHAVLSLCSTDDRYADDVHYWGGALLADYQLPWATTMLAYNARPPEPQVWGEEWLPRWLDRLAATPAFIEEWMRHQRRDEFWRHGTVCEDPAAIQCPVYLVGGWADAYRDALVGQVAQGHPERHRARTDAACLDAGLGAAARPPRAPAGALGGHHVLADSRGRAAARHAGPWCAAAGGGGRGGDLGQVAGCGGAVTRRAGRAVLRLRDVLRRGGGPARRGCGVAVLRQRAASGADGRSGGDR